MYSRFIPMDEDVPEIDEERRSFAAYIITSPSGEDLRFDECKRYYAELQAEDLDREIREETYDEQIRAALKDPYRRAEVAELKKKQVELYTKNQFDRYDQARSSVDEVARRHAKQLLSAEVTECPEVLLNDLSEEGRISAKTLWKKISETDNTWDAYHYVKTQRDERFEKWKTNLSEDAKAEILTTMAGHSASKARRTTENTSPAAAGDVPAINVSDVDETGKKSTIATPRHDHHYLEAPTESPTGKPRRTRSLRDRLRWRRNSSASS